MSDLDVKAVSGTGTFAVLNPTAGAAESDNEAKDDGGSDLPAPAKTDLETLTAKLNLASETIGRDLRFQVDMFPGRYGERTLRHPGSRPRDG